mmetsp:Transcript_79/g.160  ORF Transcript_79/g.160 Transcript_79/m.160 type:complete len:84 (-) Transcript_79:834-1085(-)
MGQIYSGCRCQRDMLLEFVMLFLCEALPVLPILVACAQLVPHGMSTAAAQSPTCGRNWLERRCLTAFRLFPKSNLLIEIAALL